MRTRTALPAFGLVALLAAAPQASAADTKDKKKSQVVAVVGGDVYTVTHEVIRNGTVLIKDGKIVAVGQDVKVPEGVTYLPLASMTVAPSGTFTSWPTATILPSLMSTVPLRMTSCVTV